METALVTDVPAAPSPARSLAQPPAAALLALVNGYRVSQAIHVAAVLGVADQLADGARASDDLAARVGAHPGTLYRLLRALASVGVLREEPERRFALTPLGACLRADVPEQIRPMAIGVGQAPAWQAWGALLHSVRTGEDAFRHVYGVSKWEYDARDPEAGARFDARMTASSQRQAGPVLAAYDFGRFASIVDVAGGQGALLAAILGAHPAARGVLFDQAHVVAHAGPLLEEAGVRDRCRIVAGSFFDAVPDGGDAYVLKSILHDWQDDQAVAILRTIRQAMGPRATLVVVERLIGPPNEDSETKFADLNMLVSPFGQERTREEFAALFAAAGFRLVSVIPTGTDEKSVIEGQPV